jgi:hypothetical protein
MDSSASDGVPTTPDEDIIESSAIFRIGVVAVPGSGDVAMLLDESNGLSLN